MTEESLDMRWEEMGAGWEMVDSHYFDPTISVMLTVRRTHPRDKPLWLLLP